MWRSFSISPSFSREALIEPGVADVAGNVEEAPREGRPHVLIELGVFAELLDGFAHLLAELVVGQRRAGDADDGESRGQAAVVGQPVERGQQFALGEVAIGAEDDDGALGHLPLKAQRVLERVLVGH